MMGQPKARRPRRVGGIELLTPLAIKNAKPGLHSDGGGLMLSVKLRSDKRSLRKAWIFRYASPVHRITTSEGEGGKTFEKGKRRDMGLGSADSISLPKVRELARQYREQVKLKLDPIDEQNNKTAADRAAKRAEIEQAKAERLREHHTLRRVARKYHEGMIEPNRTTKHSHQWITSIETHVPANVLDKPIEDVTAKELLELLQTLRKDVRETGRRVGQRLGLVFADAKLRGIVPNNPLVDISHALRESKREKMANRDSHPSLPYAQVPAFVKALHGSTDISAKAFEFLILTAARTEDVIGATWGEVDLSARVWTIPASRMKMPESHAVYLSKRAVEILKEMKALGGTHLFSNPIDLKKPLSNMAMLARTKRMHETQASADKIGWMDPKQGRRIVPHGFRASFSTWANESAQRAHPDVARPDVVEACLAHREGDRIRAAYNRAKFEDDRRALLDLWSDFVGAKAPRARKAK